ncbi:hypothetical protein [Pseudoduganella chitinolytica]|uniref:Uncharacterized protein n=1 Tax=Pseudoduganella chitinolytica TaxID=34070 RepID=A0ABY8BG28_9BURK|nr:hypothetical protein [Pseudoduganella chitinolytica]WEF34875.1 hypothetical protein PX653_08980 [Pseudoduganella chitinolytica]
MTTTQHLTVFLSAVIVGVLAIRLWPLRQADRARQQQEKARAAAREALLSKPGTAYHDGALAAIDGADMLDNPHCDPGGQRDQAMSWHCGWMYGKKLLQQVGGQP